jgi:hypothetical protein
MKRCKARMGRCFNQHHSTNEKGLNHVHNSTGGIDHAPRGCLAGLAVEFELGMWTECRTGPGSGGFVDSRADRSHIIIHTRVRDSVGSGVCNVSSGASGRSS